MREIYNIFGAITNEEQRFFSFKFFIPEISSVSFSFVKPKSDMIYNGNVINEMNVVFENGKCITIEGVYLHKFFNTPPTCVSTKDEKYLDNNPFLDNYSTEQMIKLIRDSFLYLIEEITFDTEVEQLKELSIVYCEDSCNVNKKLYSSLSQNAQNKIKTLMNESINDNTKFYDDKLYDFIKDSLLKPKIKRDMIREGEYLRNSFTEVEWGDVSKLEFKEFLIVSDSYREENIPYYTSYMDRLKELSQVDSSLILTNVLCQLKEKNDKIYIDIFEYFTESNLETLKVIEPNVNIIAEFLLDDGTELANVLFDYWWTKNYSKNISEIIS